MRKALVVFFGTLVITLSMAVLAMGDEAHPGLMREVLTSTFDGKPFIAEFNPETGIVSFFDMNGVPRDWYRVNQTEDTFRALVEANNIETNRIMEYNETGAFSYRNISITDFRTRTVYTYDAYGNVTATPFDYSMHTFHTYDEYGNVIESTLSKGEIYELRAARGDLCNHQGELISSDIGQRGLQWIGFHDMLPTNNPLLTPPIANRWFVTPRVRRMYIDLTVLDSIPPNMFLFAHFRNEIGDDAVTYRYFVPWVVHPVRFPGEPYQVRLSATMPGMHGSWPVMARIFFILF